MQTCFYTYRMTYNYPKKINVAFSLNTQKIDILISLQV